MNSHFGGKEMKKRTTYSVEFKRGAVELYKTTDRTQAEVEQELGLWRGCISGWMRQLEERGEAASDAEAVQDPARRIRELKRENAILRQERDILKKAVAIFSRPQRNGSSS
jgi:transposase